MRRQLLAIWLLVPVGAGAYHLGPGQDRVLIDDAAQVMAEAEELARQADALEEAKDHEAASWKWSRAAEGYKDALRLLPGDRVAARQSVRLELAKCRMFIGELPQASAQLQSLVDELVVDEEADPEVRRDAQRALANSQYYMTWLMRLEGVGREEWEPTIESARQTFKLLAEEAERGGDETRIREGREDLESAIRLARLDLTELQGLPLPSQ